MHKKTKEKIKLIMIWVLAVGMVLSAVYTTFFLKKDEKHVVIDKSTILNDTEENADITTGYANETSYSGSTYVPASLFSYPFKKSSAYIMNKDYINTIGKENAGTLSDRVKEGLEGVFSMNYETIDSDSYYALLQQYFPEATTLTLKDGELFYEDLKEIADSITELAKTNEIVIESKGYSDSSMVFYDEGTEIVRVKMIFAVYSCNDIEMLEKFFGVGNIILGEPFSVIYDVYTGPSLFIQDRNTYLFQEVQKVD